MSEKEDLKLSSRYIHTGNSGVTFKIHRATKNPSRARIQILNGAMGCFETILNITCDCNSFEGFTPLQIKDLGLMFLEAAYQLEQKVEDQEFEWNSPDLVSDKKGKETRREHPKIFQKFLRKKYGIDDLDFRNLQKALKKEKEGNTEETIEKRKRKIIETFFNKNNIKKKDIQRYYEKYKTFIETVPAEKNLIDDLLMFFADAENSLNVPLNEKKETFEKGSFSILSTDLPTEE